MERGPLPANWRVDPMDVLHSSPLRTALLEGTYNYGRLNSRLIASSRRNWSVSVSVSVSASASVSAIVYLCVVWGRSSSP